jgi:molybdopterin-guanine dinucleotide biosynthesis protein A/GNAT superfamily N-acetyltransferase
LAAAGLTGVLLVGGASRRFGSPKALAQFEGEPLAVRSWRTLGRACDTRIAIGKDCDALQLPFETVDDGSGVRAALVGIVAGLRAAETELVIVLPVDMPLVRAADLRRLGEACADAAIPATAPLPCALRRRILAPLERRLERGDLALRDAWDNLDARTVDIDPATLVNVNAPADLEALEIRIVPFLPEHAEGFRGLVSDTLAEFGFRADPALDPDLADPEAVYDAVWVASSSTRVVGSVALRRIGPREVELKRMYLRPELRGRGVGRRLLHMALLWSREHRIERIALDTTEAMAAARRLYEAQGFVRVAAAEPRQGQPRVMYELRL